jgi:hypothetical protein
MPAERLRLRDVHRRDVEILRSRAVHPAAATEMLANDLAVLPSLPLDALKERWQALFGTPPRPRLGRALMVRAVAYRMQEQALGGLDPATRKRLARVTHELAAGRAPSAASAPIKPGTRLLREWRGVIHEVIVLEESVRYRGKSWPSLSAVAREITGARWSGPRFFGLKSRRGDGR